MIDETSYIQDNFTEIIKILSSPNIKIISIKEIMFGDPEKYKLLDLNLRSYITLQVIDICKCQFEMEIFKSLISCFTKCQTLGWIFLKHNKLKDEHIQFIINKFDEFKSLSCLNLFNNLITKEGARNLCNNIFRCPTLRKLNINENYIDINLKISSNLKNNRNQISKFHYMVLNFQTSEYLFKLSFFPTLINSYNNGKTLLHYLASNKKYNGILLNILKFKPSPYLTGIYSDKLPIEIATIENKNILKEYMDLFYTQHHKNLNYI